MGIRRAALALVLLWVPATGGSVDVDLAGWHVAVSPHFEVYSQAGYESAKQTLIRFEEIRAFFNRHRILGLAPPDRREMRPVRVVEFRTAQQYSAVKIHPSADAYFAAVDDTNYIAMPVLSANGLGMAAHEYAHYVFYSGGTKLPPWLNEGLAELLSTATITSQGCEFGGAIAARAQVLQRRNWLRVQEFFRADKSEFHDSASLFYSQSWAVADMLVSAPGYADKFGEAVERLSSGAGSMQVFETVYGKSSEDVLADTRRWIRSGSSPRRKFPPLAPDAVSMKASPAGELQVKAVIADLLATNGDLDRARQLYEELLSRSPGDPFLLASMGTLALRQGQRGKAIDYWRSAMNAGLQDADLCYRYARLADQMDVAPEAVQQALERVIVLRPDFDEARYRLAQMESNRGNYLAALAQLQAMQERAPGRAFGYWTMLSSALNEVGRREEAVQAAAQAARVAGNAEQSARAAQLAYFAQTEMQVQYVRDGGGNLRLATTRAPRGSTVNPFVEAQDVVRSETGVLREIRCTEDRLTAVLVDVPAGAITLSVADPARVLMKTGPAEFVCGPQEQAKAVHMEYATTDQPDAGLLRGLEVLGDATYKPALQSPAAPASAPVPPGKTPSSKGETSSSPGRIR